MQCHGFMKQGPGSILHQFIPLFDIDRIKKTAILNTVKQMLLSTRQIKTLDW